MTPQDPADQAGVGVGIIPDDQGEGYEQAALDRRSSDEKNGDGSRGDADDGSAGADSG
jgi:hypothetical protein